MYALILSAVLLVDWPNENWEKALIWGSWMRREGRLDKAIHGREQILWLWTLTRFIGEFKEVNINDGVLSGLQQYSRDGHSAIVTRAASLARVGLWCSHA